MFTPLLGTVLEIDDFAFRRGRTYGTIVVDGERRHVIDLLPDHSQIGRALWLQRYPEVQLISRDRGSNVPPLVFSSLAAIANKTGFIATRSVTPDALHTAIQLVG